ncbi:hypothetical protein HDU76_008377 [Blyttiomyces sp. JEL0837]|nr:hypothetical protein HDU76_008377 [Blyttiomyces sp. JEL0837]
MMRYSALNGQESNLPKSIDCEIQVYDLSQDLISKLNLKKSSKVSIQVSLTAHKVYTLTGGNLKMFFTGVFSSFSYVPTGYSTTTPSSAPKDKFATNDSFTPDLPSLKSNKTVASTSSKQDKESYGGYKSKGLPTPPKKDTPTKASKPSPKQTAKQTLVSKNLFPAKDVSEDDENDLEIDLNQEEDSDSSYNTTNDDADSTTSNKQTSPTKTTKQRREIVSLDSDTDEETPKKKTRSSPRKTK